MKKNIYFFIGTTAELIKLAPVIRELQTRKIAFKIITSGQNKILFRELRKYLGPLKADIAFGEKKETSSVFWFALWAIKTFFVGLLLLRKELSGLNQDNSYFIVHGDTVSSLIGALIAYIYGLKIVHIEAGLRSFSFLEPFPEEFCRVIISYLVDIHFCPNKWCIDNLSKRRGVKVNTSQNTLIETLDMVLQSRSRQEKFQRLGKYLVLVVHRQEHVVLRKTLAKRMLKSVLDNLPADLACVLIGHKLTLRFLESTGLIVEMRERKNIIILPRLPYTEFVELLIKAECLITDGGSNQEEAYFLGKPCLLLRNRTERIEGLNSNVVLSRGKEEVVRSFLKNYQRYKKEKVRFSKAPSRIIVDYLLKH